MPLLHLLRQNPVIAAVKDNASLQLAIDSECQFISVLYGNICTKASMLKAARAEGFFCIHRLFIVDSISFHNIDKQVAQSNPDCIEILPGCMPKVLGWVTEKIRQPLIAGGLVCDEEDARNAINAGVVALSTTNTGVWTLAKKLL
ncbi:glycerol-3-phosphate responsive antiterminator [Escherichia coli]|uniref:glycerol-3-phosphate responsive antiterminator n=1 Tax=Escherichia coli TaxID=562 RepID=UPI0003BB4D3F|nr:glycerol-3-phosphate responsive antiterminator [Escherichia coli]ESA69648.1 glycerol-3-phosphate responsive antiterminator [Escherichia coli 113290]